MIGQQDVQRLADAGAKAADGARRVADRWDGGRGENDCADVWRQRVEHVAAGDAVSRPCDSGKLA